MNRTISIWISIILVAIVGGTIIYNLDKPIKANPCYLQTENEMYVIGIPNSKTTVGYYQVQPEFRNGKEIELTMQELSECNGTKFQNLIEEISSHNLETKRGSEE